MPFNRTGALLHSHVLQVSVFRQAMMQLCGLSIEETDSMVGEAREITRQHRVRHFELENAKLERKLQRRRKSQLAHEKARSSVAGAGTVVAPETPGVTALVVDTHAAAASGLGLHPIPVNGAGVGTPEYAAGLPRASLKESPRDAGRPVVTDLDDVIYYEPLVRILFSF